MTRHQINEFVMSLRQKMIENADRVQVSIDVTTTPDGDMTFTVRVRK